MNTNIAISEKIRLIDQADRYANEIIDWWIDKTQPKAATQYCGLQPVPAEKFDELIQFYDSSVKTLAQSISPVWALTVCIAIIENVTNGLREEEVETEIHLVAKTAIVYFYGQKTRDFQMDNNANRIKEMFINIALLHNLFTLSKMLEVVPDKDIIFINNSVRIGEANREFFDQYKKAMKDRGARQRSAFTNTRLMKKYAGAYISGVKRVLDGENPRDIQVFEDSIFSIFPPIEKLEGSRELWIYLWHVVMVFCEVFSNSQYKSRIWILDRFSEELDVDDLVWTRKWNNEYMHNNSFTLVHSNRIIERPIIRISEYNDGLFATSEGLLGDAINFRVEDSIFAYTIEDNDARNKHWGITIRDTLALEFEQKVQGKLSQNGFFAAGVSRAGAWSVNNRPVQIWSGDKNQIDVLAFKEGTNTLFLIECKLLDDFKTIERICSLYKKVLFRLDEWTPVAQLHCSIPNICASFSNDGLKNKLKRLRFPVKIVPIIVTDIKFPLYPDFSVFPDERANIKLCCIDELLSIVKNY